MCLFLSVGLVAISGCFCLLYYEIKFPFQGVYLHDCEERKGFFSIRYFEVVVYTVK